MVDLNDYLFTTDTVDGVEVCYCRWCDTEVHVILSDDTLQQVVESAIAHNAECKGGRS
jgi:hypothetical protein